MTVLVTAALEALGIPYVIGGSMASAVYGLARATMDVDVVVDLREEQVAPLVAGLGTDFYADPLSIRDAIAGRASCNLIHLPTMFKIDLFMVGDRAWDRQQLARKQRRSLDSADGPAAEVASAEDVILAKLDSSARGGMAFAIQREVGLPILYAGLGEKPEDLTRFDREAFVDGILSQRETTRS